MEKELIRILHAEDDEIDRRLVKRIMFGSPQPAEFALEQVDRISLAVEYLSNKEREFDIALMQANPDIPIVVLTGTTNREMGLEAIKNGAMDYLSKGIALEELLVRTILYALERKKAERKIKEAVEAKSEFLSIVSHELRTPLTAMKESVAIVLDGMAGEINDEQKSCLDIAKRNIDRLSRLINNVLDVQRLEAGKMKFDMKISDINEVAEQVYKTMSSPAKEKGIDLILELDGKLPKVKFDVDRITQVLTNLVNNAFKFTEKGSVIIKTGREENAVQVSVSDSGCGIKQQDMPKLFKKFEQLADSGERKTGGTGLGLAICKEIIEEHKGDIWAKSEMDKGSTFRFVLPIKEKEKVCRKES